MENGAGEHPAELPDPGPGLITTLLRTLELRDRTTARHSAAVARYSSEIARRSGLSEQDQRLVHAAALLYDIGKLAFSDRILEGCAPLADDDWKVIYSHPDRGARILWQVEGYAAVAHIVLAHHERVDGGGYPLGLEQPEIPAFARIIAVADTYDVLTARGSYRPTISSSQPVRELHRVAGSQLDERFVEVFAGALEGKGFRYRHAADSDFDAELARAGSGTLEEPAPAGEPMPASRNGEGTPSRAV